ncbi:hypothetical protein D915_007015 [Fasciola hepatica]|uniref:Uncharacterized protein n=1 Tax=Fasciola hepatica TaxID=6192 RepID=A0A4E0R832_FASHE|nr:hypothetical protein D915_007015 [Fasciola hepatica]
MLRTLHVHPCVFLPVYRSHALMAGSRGRTSDDAVQIWPPMGQECLANEDMWDDSELIAHYDRVDAFVKVRATTVYSEYTQAQHTCYRALFLILFVPLADCFIIDTRTGQPKSARSRSLTRLNRTDETVNPPIPIPPLPVPMKDLESLLRRWYEAGYSLGREHALKITVFVCPTVDLIDASLTMYVSDVTC